MSRFGIVTLSYNKPKYVGDAISSVLNQSFGDFTYLVVDNSTDKKEETMEVVRSFKDDRLVVFEETFSDEQRKNIPINITLSTKYHLKLRELGCQFHKSLADDDIIYNNCFERVDEFLKANNTCQACYYWIHYYCVSCDRKILIRDFTNTVIFNSINSPDCIIDGGMVVFHGSALDKIDFGFVNNKSEEVHMDGVFMSKISSVFPIIPLKEFLGENRATLDSCYQSKMFARKILGDNNG